ncbi:MAG: hypothetical protein KAI74_00160 [Kiritimatiellae bacterium]|nr:hypothetical protein [Kiritimatiellia bacterium]
MSLIQEALKRQQQEADPDDATTTTEPEAGVTPPIPDIPSAIKSAEPVAEPVAEPATPTESKPVKKPIGLVKNTPPPAPEEVTEEDSKKKKKKQKKKKKESDSNPWQKLILVLLILTLIIVGAAGLVFFSLKKLSKDALTELTENLPAELVKNLPVEIANNLPVATTNIPAQQEATPAPEAAVVKVLKKVAATLPEVKAQPKVEPVKWPELKLIGAVASGGSGQAILNGQFINVGNSIEGVTLKAIKGNDVILTYKNEMKILKVGDSTR